jgi:DNA-binding SARP family transcriptional activator
VKGVDRRLELLGGFAMSEGGAQLALTARKARALLALLATARQQTLPRSRLAALLWEHADAESARTSLRQALAQVRRAAGDGWIEADADALCLSQGVTTDVADVAEALARGDDAAAARLYAGPFLDGMTPDSPALEAALNAERARLADLAAGALRREMDRLGDRSEAAQAAHRLLALDPLDEAAHRRLMEWDASRGARGAARARFEALYQALRRDLGVTPADETVALMDRIRRAGGRGQPPAAQMGTERSATASATRDDVAEPPLLLVALATEEEADWSALTTALSDSGGTLVDCGAGEAAALWKASDLRAVASMALALAERARTTLSFGLVQATDADGASPEAAVPPRTLSRARRTAARADPGTVLLAPDVALRLGLAANGEAPVALSSDAVAARPELPLVGREAEIAQIEAACAAAHAAGVGLVVHVSGEAGIGKSRLAMEVASRTGLRTARVIRAGFSPFAVADRHIGQELAAGLVDFAPQAADQPFDRAVRDWLVEPQLTSEAELRLSALSAEERQKRMLNVLARMLTLAAEAPGGLSVVIEDCHWAPAGAGDFLLDLVGRLSEMPVTILLTERPHDASLDRRLATRGRTGLVRLTLAPLSPAAATRLAELAAPGRADAAEALEQAGGHPLFLLRLLEANWTAGNLPATVTGLVLEQIERLPEDARAALRRASVLGTTFDPADVAAIFPGMIPPRPHGDIVHVTGAGLAFGHDLVRQAIYDDLPEATRREWHACAAAHFRGTDPVRWAEHARLAHDGAEACRAAAAAANLMVSSQRLTSALSFIEEGLGHGGDAEAVAELHSCRAGIRRMRGDLRGALEDYRAAHAVALADTTRVAMLVRQALVLHRLDLGAEANRALDTAEDIADAIGLTGLGRAEIHEQRGNRAFVEGDTAECLRQHSAGLAAAEAVGDPRGIARAHGGLGDAHFAAGRLRTAHRHFDRAVTMAADAGLGMVHQEFGFMRSYTLFFSEPGARAHLLADLAVESAAGAAADRAEMIARETRAEMRLAALDLDGAQEDIDRLAELVAGERESRFAADLTILRAWHALRCGSRDEAFAQLEPHLDPATGSYYNGAIFLVLGALSAADPMVRADLLAAGEQRLIEGALSCATIWFHCFAIETAALNGDLARGRKHADMLRQYTKSESLGLVELAVRTAALRFGAEAQKDELAATRRALEDAHLLGFEGILLEGQTVEA